MMKKRTPKTTTNNLINCVAISIAIATNSLEPICLFFSFFFFFNSSFAFVLCSILTDCDICRALCKPNSLRALRLFIFILFALCVL